MEILGFNRLELNVCAYTNLLWFLLAVPMIIIDFFKIQLWPSICANYKCLKCTYIIIYDDITDIFIQTQIFSSYCEAFRNFYVLAYILIVIKFIHTSLIQTSKTADLVKTIW